MIEQKFKPGDIVVLKSDGPAMTVKCYEPKDGSDVTCTWFRGHDLEEKSFPQDLLTLESDIEDDY